MIHNDLNIIVAVDDEGGFGRKGKIPWDIPEDMKHFIRTTKGAVCVMGRKTYEDMAKMARTHKRDISKSILPNRECYVVSSTRKRVKGATIVEGIRRVTELHPTEKIFVLGGEKMFIQALSTVNKVYCTVIDKNYDCDLFFPVQILEKDFRILSGQELTAESGETLHFMEYGRK